MCWQKSEDPPHQRDETLPGCNSLLIQDENIPVYTVSVLREQSLTYLVPDSPTGQGLLHGGNSRGVSYSRAARASLSPLLLKPGGLPGRTNKGTWENLELLKMFMRIIMSMMDLKAHFLKVISGYSFSMYCCSTLNIVGSQ